MPGRVDRHELSPTLFLERAGSAYADHPAVTDGNISYSWKQFRSRSRRMASALLRAGLESGERVAFLAHNSEPVLLGHHGVPLAGGVLVPLNTRLSAEEIEDIVERSGATRLFYSESLEPKIGRLEGGIWRCNTGPELERLLETGSDAPPAPLMQEEDSLISINYTSGTTGPPKGVMCTHRAAFLNALAMAIDHRLHLGHRYLWTLPMFHCNGWMFPWALAAVGAESVPVPEIDPEKLWGHFLSGTTHFCAAPTVLTMLVNDAAARPLGTPIRVFAAGSAPTPTLLGQLEELGFEVDHVYGLTETSGPCTISVMPPDYLDLPLAARARMKARQGYGNITCGEVRVVDEHLAEVPSDGKTMGEVVVRGNLVMKGYYRDRDATDEAFENGWFHTGDLAVRHTDESFEIVDRKKDIIVSGGENVSSIEVEQAITRHADVLECAVVRSPDEKWGEVVKAFVTLKPGKRLAESDIIEHCRQVGLGRFKVPRKVEFGPLPKTPTGKIQKHRLRESEWRGLSRRV